MRMVALLLFSALATPGFAAYGDDIKWFFKGNSDGQLINAAVRANPLVMVGTVPNPSSPTPPEGDRWLGYNFNGNYFLHPTNSPVSQDRGVWVAVINPGAGSAGQLLNAGAAPYFSFFLNGTGVWLDYTARGGALTNLDCTGCLTPSVNNEVRLEWDDDGIRIYVNRLLRASTTNKASFTWNDTGWFGYVPCCGFRILSGYIDAVMLSSNSKENYPPSTIDTLRPVPLNQMQRIQ